MKEKELEPIEIRCVICDSLYETLYVVEDGCPYDFCCSILCYNQYHSLPYITLPSQRDADYIDFKFVQTFESRDRDQKLNELLGFDF